MLFHFETKVKHKILQSFKILRCSPHRCSYPLPQSGERSDWSVGQQSPARFGAQLLPCQGQVQREQGGQHDHPEHQFAGPARQGHQHIQHEDQVTHCVASRYIAHCRERYYYHWPGLLELVIYNIIKNQSGWHPDETICGIRFP